jgi:hypothetical protein
MHKAGARWAGYLDGGSPAPWPPPVRLLYKVATRGREAFLGGGGGPWSLGTGGTVTASLQTYIKGKNSCTAFAHYCSWGCAKQVCDFTGHNYTCSLLWFGAVPNSNTQLILYTCRLPTSPPFYSVNVRDEACPLNPRTFLPPCGIRN